MPWRHVPVSDTRHDKGHGRIEQRTIKVVTVAAGIDFPHAAQALQITRKTRTARSRKRRTETVYAVTDLPPEQARPHQLAQWICGHWSIENRLHWVRSTSLTAKTSHRSRTGNGPQVMATLRVTWPSASTDSPAPPTSPTQPDTTPRTTPDPSHYC